MFRKKQKFVLALIALFILSIGMLIGYILKPTQVVVSQKAIRENNTKYSFIHPLLAVTRTSDDPSPEYKHLKEDIEYSISKSIKTGDIDNASIYFIGYGTGGYFAINENETYAPASMLKVVILVAYLKLSESEDGLLNKVYIYNEAVKKSYEAVPFETPSTLRNGSGYKVSTLLEKMIVDSDNGAKDLLLENITDAYLTGIYTDLGLAAPAEDGTYVISAKAYSLFLRILYNASYLNDENSEMALKLLTQATYKNGLVKDLPEGTVVAHKFGEHINSTNENIDSLELHDCGIIYLPENPYLLCVMTRGKSLTNLENTISTISKNVYDIVSKK